MQKTKRNIIHHLGYSIYLIAFVLTGLGLFNAYKTYKYHEIYVTYERWPSESRRYNEFIGYEMTPSFSAKILKGGFEINSHRLGYRIPVQKDAINFQPQGILFAGCSFTYGDEVNAEETFSAYIEDSLKIPAYNYGVCSYSYASVIRQLQYLKQQNILDSLNPKYLVIGAGDWLINRTLSPFYPTPHLQLEYPYLSKSNGSVYIQNPTGFFSIQHLYKMKKVYDKNLQDKSLTWERFWAMYPVVPKTTFANIKRRFWRRPDISSYEIYSYLFQEIKEITKGKDVQVIVLWMPTDEGATINEGLEKAVNKFPDVLLANGYKALEKWNVPAPEFVDRHPGPSAHYAYACAIIELLKKDKAWKH